METFTPKKIYEADQDSSDDINVCPSESISSTIFPWKRSPSRKHFVVSRGEGGHLVQPAAFYLCFAAVLLFCSGVLVTGGAIWSILYRVPYSYIFNKSLIMDAGNFNLCGGLICFPCSWIAWTSHENRKNYVYLPLMILLLIFSMLMLTTGAILGVLNRLKICFQQETYPPVLRDCPYRTMLNETLLSTLDFYGESFEHQHSWDKMQIRLRCCGVNGPDDWIAVDKEIPRSCYTKVNGLNKSGCINLIAYDIAWQICLLAGFSLIALGIEIITILLTTFLYVKEKQSRRCIPRQLTMTGL